MPVALELVAPVLVAPVHAAPVVGLVGMAPAALSLAAAALCRGARAPTALNCVRPSPCTFMRHAAANRTSHQICRHPSTCCLNAPRAAASLAPLKSHFFLHHSTLPSEMLHFLQAINERLPVIGLRTSGQSTATRSPMEPSLLAPSSARPAQRAPTPSKRSCAPVPLAATLVPLSAAKLPNAPLQAHQAHKHHHAVPGGGPARDRHSLQSSPPGAYPAVTPPHF